VIWNEQVTGSKSIRVNLGRAYSLVKVYDPTIGTAPLKTLRRATSLTLTLSDHPVIIEIAAAKG